VLHVRDDMIGDLIGDLVDTLESAVRARRPFAGREA
jgi:hypothetical protein